jgi:hypothetical protein
MRYLIISFLLTSLSVLSQEYLPFTGKLVYSIEFTDSVTKQKAPVSFMTIYTNDTIVRLETQSTQLGSQVIIRHMELHKYYILLQLENQKLAIQHQDKKDTTASRFTFKNKFGKQKICGLKAKKTQVKDTKNNTVFNCYYTKKYSPKYLEVLKGIPGLPLDYYVQTEEGMYHYRLIELKEETIKKDMFGIPSDYQKVSFDDFIKSLQPQN